MSTHKEKREEDILRSHYIGSINWAHRSVDKHTTHKIDLTIYSAIEEWNSAKMACSCECFH